VTEPHIELQDVPHPPDVAALIRGLVAHNATVAQAENMEPIAAFARSGGRVVGGADGRTHWEWLYVSHLWVDADFRRRGLGSRLMASVEEAARVRGCRAAWLDTFSFQAKPFYVSLGYRQFGELADFPPGHTRFFLAKTL
jgi:GNAT superfamily N-acetyltransferase